MQEKRKYWVGFNLVNGIGPVRLQKLISVFGCAEAAWNASQRELSSAGLGPRLIKNLLQVRSQLDLDRYLESLTQKGISILTMRDPDYPARLAAIDAAPPVLYTRGRFSGMDQLAVAIVGSRQFTSYGRRVAEEAAAYLAEHGVTVVSGLARGIDTLAHQAALDAGGRTIAVLGSGIDQIYPPENRKLAARLVEDGVLVSDYPPGTKPERMNFPPRNRIISGLSSAVLIVEAGTRSGALITANFAADQGRDVFAVPGGIYNSQSSGPNNLIRTGAIPYLEPGDLIQALQMEEAVRSRPARSILPDNPREAQILGLLGAEPIHVDELSRLAEMSPQNTAAALAMMELKGWVSSTGGMQYIRK